MSNIDIKDIKYLFTREGGGWGKVSELYIITKKDEIYYTNTYDSKNLLNCTPIYICPLYDEDRENFCISSVTSWDENGNRTTTRKHLFDLLNSNGKLDFENVSSCIAMDAEIITMYKNNKGNLKKIWEATDSDAVSYILALYHKYS